MSKVIQTEEIIRDVVIIRKSDYRVSSDARIAVGAEPLFLVARNESKITDRKGP